MAEASAQQSLKSTDVDRATMTDVKSDVASIRDDLASLRKDALDYAAGAAERGSQAIREGAEGGLDTFQEYVRRNPMVSVLVAVGVGAVLGQIIRRS